MAATLRRRVRRRGGNNFAEFCYFCNFFFFFFFFFFLTFVLSIPAYDISSSSFRKSERYDRIFFSFSFFLLLSIPLFLQNRGR